MPLRAEIFKKSTIKLFKISFNQTYPKQPKIVFRLNSGSFC